MKVRLSLGLLVASGLILTACNRPAGEPPPNKVATMVAATLAAAPTMPPTTTPPPSATPIITPSLTPTETATPDLTPSATLPELASDDPRRGLNLATPDYRDDFSVRFTWGEPSFGGATNLWEEGRLRTTDHLTDLYITWSTNDLEAGNLYVEVNAEIGDCSEHDSYGIAVRVGGEQFNNGYTLEFSCDGAFRMRRFAEGAVNTIREWTVAEAIRPGPNTTNTMGFLANGHELHAVANGVLLGQVEDTHYSFGTFGLFANAVDTPGLTAYFDNFNLWYLTP
jgi:hypothetical protein